MTKYEEARAMYANAIAGPLDASEEVTLTRLALHARLQGSRITGA